MNCKENILSLIPPSGKNGISSYTYVAYADDVTLGTPDVVTAFNASTPLTTSEWFAIITSSTPLTPIEANFQGHWAKFKGADGTGAAGIAVENNNIGVTTNSTILNFRGTGLTGVNAQNAGGGQTDITIITAGLIKLTRSQALIEIANNTLIAGASYWIYDVGEGADPVAPGAEYAGIILRAITTNLFSSSGVFIERNIDRTVVTVKYVLGAPDLFLLNDVVEYKNSTYQLTGSYSYVTTGDPVLDLASFNPQIDTLNWTRVTRDSNVYYVTNIGNCDYDIINDLILSKSDSNGNVLTCSNGNISILTGFRWGHTNFINNTIKIVSDGDLDLSFINSCKHNTLVNCAILTNRYDYSVIEFYRSIITNSTFTYECVMVDSVIITNCELSNCSTLSYCGGESYTTSTFTSCGFNYPLTISISNSILSNSSIASSGTFLFCKFHNYILTGNNPSTTVIECNTSSGTIASNTNCTISNCEGSIKILSNIDCYIHSCASVNISSSYSEISNNIGCDISLVKIENIGKINNNSYIKVLDASISNGYIRNNVNSSYPSIPITNTVIAEVRLSGEAMIRNNEFVTPATIGVGQLHGQHALIENIIFDTGTYSIASISALQGNIINFTLDNIGISAYNSGYSNQYVNFPVNSAITNTYDHMIATNDSSNFYGFLDMDDPTVYDLATLKLTIPNYLQHCGEIWLYNCGSEVISNIVKPSYGFNLLKFPITFRTIDHDVTFLGIAGAVYPEIATDATGVSTGYTITGNSSISFKLSNTVYSQTSVNIIS